MLDAAVSELVELPSFQLQSVSNAALPQNALCKVSSFKEGPDSFPARLWSI